MLLFSSSMFDKFLQASGGASSTVAYSDEDTWRVLGQLEKAFVQVRVTQVTVGSGTPSLSIALETSNDGIFWKTKSTPISNLGLTAGQAKEDAGFDTGTNPAGCFVRLAVTLTATTNPAANIQITVTGRSD